MLTGISPKYSHGEKCGKADLETNPLGMLSILVFEGSKSTEQGIENCCSRPRFTYENATQIF